jgi:hypothetical protein
MKSPDEHKASEAAPTGPAQAAGPSAFGGAPAPPSDEGKRPEADSWGLFSRCPRLVRHVRGRRQAGDPRNRSKLLRARGCHRPRRFERKL